MKNRALVLLLLLLCISVRLEASSGTEGAAFLDIPVGARPAALGSAYSALATDAYAPVWNPAGLGFLQGTQAAAQHLSYLESIHYEFLSTVFPVAEGKALGLSVQYLGSGDITETDPSGEATGQYSTHYAAYSLAYGHRLSDKLSLGLTGKWINAKLADVSANAYAADIGSLYRATDKVALAATITNLGTQMTFTDQADSLPMAFHLAGVFKPENHWNLAVEGVYAKTGLLSGHMGLEWKPMDMIAIRTGYKTDTIKELTPMAGLTVGMGLKVWGQELSYAWLPYGDLGNTQYFSFVARFGQSKEEKENLILHQGLKRHRSVKGHETTPADIRKDDPEYRQLMQLLEDETERNALAPQP